MRCAARITDLDNNIQISESGLTRVNEKRRRYTGQHTTRSNTVTADYHLTGIETWQDTSLEWTTTNNIQTSYGWLVETTAAHWRC